MTGFPLLFQWAQPFYDAALDGLSVVMDVSGKAIIGGLSPLITTAQQSIAGMSTFITTRIPEGLGAVSTFFVDAPRNIQNALGSYFENVVTTTAGNIAALNTNLVNFVDPVVTWVQNAPQNFFDVVSPLTEGLVTVIQGGVEGIGAVVTDGIVGLESGLAAGFQGIITNIVAPFQQLIAGIPAAIGTGIGGAFQAIPQFIGGIPQAILGAIGTVVNEETIGNVIGIMQGLVNSLMITLGDVTEAFIHPLLTPIGSPPQDVIAGAIGTIVRFGIAASTVALPFIAGELIHPLKELGLGQLSAFIFDIAGFSRYSGAISGTIADRTLAAPLKYALNFLVHPYKPPASDYNKLLWRGHIDEQGFRDLLAYDGLDTIWHDAYVDLSKNIPGASDLVRFAVREVFGATGDENIAALRQWIQRQGYDPYWADAYWTAHWNLPGITQVYEMEARGVTMPKSLEEFLAVADVMPEWRQALLDIRYSVIPRVDLRYAYQDGLVSREDLIRSMRATGLSPDDAVLEADIQIRRALEGEINAVRSEIEGDFKEGLIDEPQTRSDLEALGYAGLFIDVRIEALKRRRERDLILETVGDVIAAYKKDLVSEQDTRTTLRQLLVDTERIDQLMQSANIVKSPKGGS